MKNENTVSKRDVVAKKKKTFQLERVPVDE
jgi:hypothetical protein